MLSWTWFTWPDPIVDFGRELYVPWQITQGKVLYRDIAHFNGPLSPYFNAMVFTILGVSLRSIVLVNLLILAGLTWMIWRLWALIADRFSATAACVVLLTVFSFIQLGGIGNYNFVTPYSHEITHGVALSFVAMMCIAGYLQKPRPLWLIAAGIVLGMIFLTKVEVFVAAFPAVVIGAVLATQSARLPRRHLTKSLGGLALALLIPIALAFALLSLAMPAREALRGLLGSWLFVFDSRITGMLFYRRILGVVDIGQSFGAILLSAAFYGAWIALAIVIAMMLRRPAQRKGWIAGAVFVLGAIIATILFLSANLNIWQQSLRGLSLVAPAIAIGTFILALRRRSNERAVLGTMLSIFAALLLLKMFLNVMPYHYGFALAMPATLVVLAAALGWLPEMIDRRGGFGWATRAALLPLVGLFVFVHLYIFGTIYADKTTRVSQGADDFWADPRATPGDRRGHAVNLMLDALSQLPPDSTLAVVPEGVMLNYLSGRTNPTPYINLMPPEVLMFGQDRIVRGFEEHPPDYIVLVRGSDPSEYGYKSFAADYGAEIFVWIKQRYEPVPTPQEPKFPLLLLRKK